VKNGFKGPIYATRPQPICAYRCARFRHIQEKDTEFVTKRFHRRRSLDPTAKDGAVQPLYTAADAEATLPLFRPVALHATQELGPGAAYQTVDAGHMLGSSAVVVTERVNGKELRLGFSGDLGHPGLPSFAIPSRCRRSIG